MANTQIQDTIVEETHQIPNVKSEVIADFSLKTLRQLNDKTLSNEPVLEFANAISSPVEDIPGAYIEYKLQYIPRATQFNRQAFIPSNLNVGSTTDIRRDVDKLWKAHRISLPSLNVDSNIVQFRNDYKKNSYVGKLLNQEEFVRESFAELEVGIEYERANRVLMGKDMVSWDGSTTLHAVGLKDLITVCKADTAKAVTAIDLTDPTSQKNIVYTPNTAGTGKDIVVECFAQLNTLIEYMKSPNKCFSNISGLLVPGVKTMTLISTIATIEAIKSLDMNYFKKLEELFDVKTVKAIPKTSIDVSYIDANTPAAQVCDLIDLQTALGLADGQIFICESNLIKKFDQLSVQSAGKEFPNNLTESHFVQGCPFNDVLASSCYAMFTGDVLVSKYTNTITTIPA